MQAVYWEKCGKFTGVKIVGEIGLDRYIEVTHENGHVTYTYDLSKGKTKNYKYFLN